MKKTSWRVQRSFVYFLGICFLFSSCGTTTIVRNLQHFPPGGGTYKVHPYRVAVLVDKQFFAYHIQTASTWTGDELYIIRSPASLFARMMAVCFDSGDLIEDIQEASKGDYDMIARMEIHKDMKGWNKSIQTGCPVPNLKFHFIFETLNGKQIHKSIIGFPSCTKEFSLVSDQRASESFAGIFSALAKELENVEFKPFQGKRY